MQYLTSRSAFLLTLLLATVFSSAAISRLHYAGEYDNLPPGINNWFDKAVRPGSDPNADWHSNRSCCGEADAYEADEFETDSDGQLYAIITEGDVNGPTAKEKIPPGTRLHIHPSIIIEEKSFLQENHTGHGWVWVSGGTAICYVFPSGI